MAAETNWMKPPCWLAVFVVLVSGGGCDGGGSTEVSGETVSAGDMDASDGTDSVRDVGKDVRKAEDGRVALPDVAVECDEMCSVLESCGFAKGSDECVDQCEQRAFESCYRECVGEPTDSCQRARRCQLVCTESDAGTTGDGGGS
jgi:hypothetical protein